MENNTSRHFLKRKPMIFIECKSAEKNNNFRKTNYPMLKLIPTYTKFSYQKERQLSHKVHHKNYITEEDDFNNYIPMKLIAKIKSKKLKFNNYFHPNKEVNFERYDEMSSRNDQAVIM